VPDRQERLVAAEVAFARHALLGALLRDIERERASRALLSSVARSSASGAIASSHEHQRSVLGELR